MGDLHGASEQVRHPLRKAIFLSDLFIDSAAMFTAVGSIEPNKH
jgi:hypothetical protein